MLPSAQPRPAPSGCRRSAYLAALAGRLAGDVPAGQPSCGRSFCTTAAACCRRRCGADACGAGLSAGRRAGNGPGCWPPWSVSCRCHCSVTPRSAGAILDAPDIPAIVTGRGFHAAWLLPFGVYFVAANATLEELFWRGVVLNELRGTSEAVWTVGRGLDGVHLRGVALPRAAPVAAPRLGRGDRAGDPGGGASSSPGCTGRRIRSSCRFCGTGWCLTWA